MRKFLSSAFSNNKELCRPFFTREKFQSAPRNIQFKFLHSSQIILSEVPHRWNKSSMTILKIPRSFSPLPSLSEAATSATISSLNVDPALEGEIMWKCFCTSEKNVRLQSIFSFNSIRSCLNIYGPAWQIWHHSLPTSTLQHDAHFSPS